MCISYRCLKQYQELHVQWVDLTEKKAFERHQISLFCFVFLKHLHGRTLFAKFALTVVHSSLLYLLVTFSDHILKTLADIDISSHLHLSYKCAHFDLVVFCILTNFSQKFLMTICQFRSIILWLN